MRAAQLAMCIAVLSSEGLAAEPGRPRTPAPTPPPGVEAPPLKPPRPGRARFVQRRLARPSSGEGTPLVYSPTAEPTLHASPGAFAFEPGVAVESSWPTGQTAWLVRDLDGDDEIASGRELFGSFTLLHDGRRAEQGFEALSELDVDGDGVVGPGDVGYDSLRWWFDLNGDRRAQPGELVRLGGVVLPLAFERDDLGRERVRLAHGWLVDVHLRFTGP